MPFIKILPKNNLQKYKSNAVSPVKFYENVYLAYIVAKIMFVSMIVYCVGSLIFLYYFFTYHKSGHQKKAGSYICNCPLSLMLLLPNNIFNP